MLKKGIIFSAGVFTAIPSVVIPSVFESSTVLAQETVSLSTERVSLSSPQPATIKSPSELAVILNEEAVQLIFQGERASGMEKLKQAHKLDPNNPTVLYNLAGVFLTEGEAEQAAAVMRQAVAIDPKDISFLNRLAESQFASSKLKEAIDTYEQVIKLDPRNDQALLRAGMLYGMQRDWEKSEQKLRQGLKLRADDRELIANLGSVLVVQEKFSEGVKLLEQAQELRQTAETAVAIGMAYEGLDKIPQAIAHYEVALKLNSNDPHLPEHLANLRKEVSLGSEPVEPKSAEKSTLESDLSK